MYTLRWEFLVSQNAYGFPVRIGKKPVQVVLCPSHRDVLEIFSGSEVFDEVCRCDNCRHLTEASYPWIRFNSMQSLGEVFEVEDTKWIGTGSIPRIFIDAFEDKEN